MMYNEQLSKSRLGAADLSGELCRWLHGQMQCDGCHSSGFRQRTDRSFYISYDITDVNFVSKVRLYYPLGRNGSRPIRAARATTSPHVQKWSSEAILFIKSSLVANETFCQSEL